MKKSTLHFLASALICLCVGASSAFAADTWKLVTDASTLAVGDKIVIAAKAADKAMSTTQNTSNRASADIVKSADGSTIDAPGNNVQVITLGVAETSPVSGAFTLQVGDGSWLYAPSTTANQLKVQTSVTVNGQWKITINDDAEASIISQGPDGTKPLRSLMCYNTANGGLFACYLPTNPQGAIVIYRLTAGTVDPTVVPAPRIDPRGGMYYEALKVGVSTYGADTTVYYRLNGGTATAYTDSISINANTTLEAWAVTTSGTSSDTTKAVYTFPEGVADIAAFLAAGQADATKEYKINGPVQVSYSRSNTNSYGQDESAGILIYKAGKQYTMGQTLTGLVGKYTVYNGMYEIEVTYLPEATEGTLEPIQRMNLGLVEADLSRYVAVNDVAFTADHKSIYTGTDTLVLFSGITNDLTVTTPNVAKFTVKGIYSVNKTVRQFIPLAIDSVLPPTIAFAAEELDFGQVLLGDSAVKTVNMTGENLNRSVPVYVEAPFRVMVDGNYVTAILTDGGNLNKTISVVFFPTQAGDYEKSLTAINDEANASLNLKGTALEPASPIITANPTALDFGTLNATGDPQVLTFALQGANLKGDVVLRLEDASGVFTMDQSSVAQQDGAADTTVTISLNATAEGTYTGTIHITSEGVQEVLISLSATVVVPQLTQPADLEAGQVTTNTATISWTAVEGATNYVLNVTKTSVGFSETFDQMDGKGGNDDTWNGSIAASAVDTIDGWDLQKAYKADACIKLGTGSVQGVATTPVLDIEGEYQLRFRAAAWNAANDATTLTVEISNGTIETSEVTLLKGEWSDYSITINAKRGARVTFKGAEKNGRFFLDDVMVVSVVSVAGFPKEVGNVTNYELTGLEQNTEYTCTITAKADYHKDSPISAALSFKTQNDDTRIEETAASSLRLEGSLLRNPDGLRLNVYTAAGQLVTTATTDVDLAAYPGGLYIVRAAGRSFKLVK